MIQPYRLLASLLPALLLISSAPAEEAGSLQDAVKYLEQYNWGQNTAPLAPIEKAIVASEPGDDTRLTVELALGRVLAGDASRAAKDFACRKLARIGTARVVGQLEVLLPDAELSDMARYALERIGSEPACNALRKALPNLGGEQQIGVVNSLGMLRDKAAVPLIGALLANTEAELVSSALMALGRIGTAECVEPLLAFESKADAPLKAVCANALLALAEARRTDGNADTAMRIYERLNAEGNPLHTRAGAFRGLVITDTEHGTRRVLDVLRSGDAALVPYVRGIVLQVQTPGTAQRLADGLATLPTDRQVTLLKALAALGDTAAGAAVRKAAEHEDASVRLAALEALGAAGTVGDVAFLATRTASENGAEAVTAFGALSVMKGERVDERIAAELVTTKAPVRAWLIRCLGKRNARETAGKIVTCLGDENATVRAAALVTLGELGSAAQIEALVRHLKTCAGAEEREATEDTLSGIASRDGETASPILVSKLKGTDDNTRKALLRALGKTGCKTALQAVVETVESDGPLADEAIRVLSGWRNADAAPHLLAVAKTNEKLTRKVLALRGYVRLVGSSEAIKSSDKVKKLAEAMAVAPRVDEKKLVLGAYAGIASASSLNKVLPLIGDKDVGNEACNAAVRIGEKLVKKDRKRVRDAMQQVIEKTRNDKIRASAQKLLKKAG